MLKKWKVLIVVVVLLVLGAGGYFIFSNYLGKSKYTVFKGKAIVKMGDDGYVPQNFTVKKGTVVTFENDSTSLRWPASDPHPSHIFYPELDPKQPIAKGATWDFKFDKVGTWGYHDHLAPYITGTIEVTE